MGTIWVKEMTGGLDTRRLPETTPGGVLIKAQDGHITRGGEFEKRAAFVAAYALPAGTTGLAHDASGLVTFGAAVEPAGMPSGVTYQRLVRDPASPIEISRILSWDLYDGKLYVSALFQDGAVYHFYDGVQVDDWFDGRARAYFNVISGSAGTVADITVNGVSIVTSPVSWNTDAATTASDIAAEINGTTSSPNYTATASGVRVNIVAEDAGDGPNGYVVTPTLTGDIVLWWPLDPTTTPLLMRDGVTSTAFTPAAFVKTVRYKIYATATEILHFSGIDAPTSWTTDATGAGFVVLSKEDSGADNLKALARYQDYLAIFAKDVTIIYFVDADPDNNSPSQVLVGTGTNHPGSVTQFGDADVFYLDASGLRSLRARDSSNAAATTDIGVPIDDLVVAKIADLNGEEHRVFGLINPLDKRFWLIMKDEIFVFSFFENAKVSAWSTYTTATTVGGTTTSFDVDAATTYGSRPYLRSGDTIYAYGGLGPGLAYDETPAEMHLPYLDANKPTADKDWDGIDVALTGLWEISAATAPTDLDAAEVIARAYKTTYNMNRVPFSHSSSHVSLRFVSQGDGRAVVSACVIHYSAGEGEA